MSRRRHPHKNWKKSTLEKDERYRDTNIQRLSSWLQNSLAIFFGWVGVVPRKAEDALYHMYLISYSRKILSSCPYGTPMIPWHQKKIATHKMWHIFWATEWLAVFQDLSISFPMVFWLTAPWCPPWPLDSGGVGFTMSQVLWSKALAHSAALSKVGTWKTDMHRLKTLERCQGDPPKKDCFLFL